MDAPWRPQRVRWPRLLMWQQAAGVERAQARAMALEQLAAAAAACAESAPVELRAQTSMAMVFLAAPCSNQQGELRYWSFSGTLHD